MHYQHMKYQNKNLILLPLPFHLQRNSALKFPPDNKEKIWSTKDKKKHNVSKLFLPSQRQKKPKQKPNNPDRKYTQSYSSLVHEFKQSVMKIKIMFRNSFLQILRWFLSYCYKHIFPRPIQFIIIVRSIYFSTNWLFLFINPY